MIVKNLKNKISSMFELKNEVKQVLNDKGEEVLLAAIIKMKKQKVGAVFITESKLYLAEHVENKMDKHVITKEINLKDIESVKADFYFIKGAFVIKTEKEVLDIQLKEQRKLLLKTLEDSDISVEMKERKFWNKIYGYRSRNKINMIIASFFYFMMLVAAVTDEQSASEVEKKSVVVDKVSENKQINKEKKEDEEKESKMIKEEIEEKQIEEEERLALEKAEEERLNQEQQQMEVERLAEEKRKQEEAERLAEEKRKQEEAARLAEEKRLEEEEQASQRVEHYQNCTELRKVYPSGVSSDHPAYDSKHDRDKDNWACEN